MINRFNIFHPNYIVDKSIRDGLQDSLEYVQGILLDIGCGDSPYFDLFSTRIDSYVGINFFQEEAKDRHPSCAYLIGQGEHLPLRDNSVDTVLCTEVLEHVPEPDFLMQEIRRVLKPGGCLLVTVPQIWYLHHQPHDYRRYTKHGLEYLFKKYRFKVLKLKERGNFWLALGQMINYYFDYSFSVFSGRRKTVEHLMFKIMRAVRKYIYVFTYGLCSFLDRFDRARLDTLGYTAVVQKQ